MDTYGNAVPEAGVQLVWLNSRDSLLLTTSESGRFYIPNLPSGEYGISVTKSGFKTSHSGSITLQARNSVRFDVTLEIGAVHESVSVTSDTLMMDPSTPTQSTSLTGEQLVELPLVSIGGKRDIAAFLAFMPGVSNENTWGPRVNGANAGNSEVFLDGAPASQGNARGTIKETGPAIETIGEFSVVANSFNAEFGRTGSWFMNIAIASGTSSYHGSVFDHYANDALNARSFFQSSRARIRQHEGGLTFSGPVRIPGIYDGQNRTFFFFGQQMFYYRQLGGSSLATSPTPEFRNGDFSQLKADSGAVIPIFDPASTNSNGRGGVTRTQFAGNVLPSSRISEVSARVLPLISLPDLEGLQSYNFRLRTGAALDTFITTIKVDHSLSEKQRIAVTSLLQSRPAANPGRGWGLGLPIDGSEEPKNVESFTLRLNHDYVLNSAWVHHLTLGGDYMKNSARTTTLGEGWNDMLGIAGLPADPGMFPQVNFSGGTATPLGLGGRNYSRNTSGRISLSENLAWVSGRHVSKFGVSYIRESYGNFEGGGASGVFGFSNLTTSQPSASEFGRWGHAFASFLLGEVDNTSTRTTSSLGWRTRHHALFAQDEWRATNRLTLSFGLRWEHYPGVYEVHDRATSFDPSIPNPAASGLLGSLVYAGRGPGRIGRRAFADTWSGLAPRVGVAYSLGWQTVLRASGGIYFAPGSKPRLNSYGFEATPSFRSPDSFSAAYQWDSVWPQDWKRPPIIDPSFQNGQNVSGVLRDSGRAPQVVSWTASLQRQFSNDIAAEISYIGSKSTHLELGGTPFGGPDLTAYLNTLDEKYLSLGPLLYQDIDSSTAAVAGIASPFLGFARQSVHTIGQALKPYPQYLNIYQEYAPQGIALYNSLQVKAVKRYANGLTLLAFYTWSKNLTDTDNAPIDLGQGPGLVQNPANRRGEYSVSTDGPPHVFIFHAAYEFPPLASFGPVPHTPILSKIFNGWRVSGYMRRASGRALSIAASNHLVPLGFYRRANLVSGRPIHLSTNAGEFDPATDRFLNPSAFSEPGLFRLGNTARNLDWARSWPQKRESLAITKLTEVAENVQLEFRAEANNPFNLVRWSAPITNISDSDFGRVIGADGGRTLQLTLAVKF